MNGSVKWSDESTREFIQLRYKLRHLFNGRKHQCEKAYSRIVEELGLINIITPTQARKKWSNLLQKYMDIKGGYSTANVDWPYFPILDEIVPLMRKEKIEKTIPTSVDSSGEAMVDIETPAEECLQITMEPAQDPLSASPAENRTMSAEPSTPQSEVCKTEVVEGEPPRKRGRSRRAAQRARDRWWGAVEEDDVGSDSTSSAIKGEMSSLRNSRKSSTHDDSHDTSQMELQTFQMLRTCSNALTDIRETLSTHVQQQSQVMQNLQQTVVSQGNTIKELLSTLASQNAALLAVMSNLSTSKPQHQGLYNRSFNSAKQRAEEQPLNTHQPGQSIINTLNQSAHGSSDMAGL